MDRYNAKCNESKPTASKNCGSKQLSLKCENNAVFYNIYYTQGACHNPPDFSKGATNDL